MCFRLNFHFLNLQKILVFTLGYILNIFLLRLLFSWVLSRSFSIVYSFLVTIYQHDTFQQPMRMYKNVFNRKLVRRPLQCKIKGICKLGCCQPDYKICLWQAYNTKGVITRTDNDHPIIKLSACRKI